MVYGLSTILFVIVPKSKKKAKKAKKRKTAAVRNSAINMQIKWGIKKNKNAVNVIFSIISFVSVYLYIFLSLFFFFGYKLENIKLHTYDYTKSGGNTIFTTLSFIAKQISVNI